MKTNLSKKTLKIPGILFLFQIIIMSGYGQSVDSVNLYYIQTSTNNEYTGQLIQQDSTVIVLKTKEFDSLVIKRNIIKTMEKVNPDRFKKGELWPDNPQSARYFWAPNGYSLRKGEAYYQNVLIFFNQVSVGVTDHFTMGVGIVPVFFFGLQTLPMWIAPKFSVPVVKDKLNIGAGALIAGIVGEDGTATELAYGTITLGPKDKNLSLGIGYGHNSSGWSNSPTINLSGMIRISPKGYLITEDYYISRPDGHLTLLTLGGRAMFERASFDFGAILPVFDQFNSFFLIPWVGVTVPFGKVYNPEAH